MGRYAFPTFINNAININPSKIDCPHVHVFLRNCFLEENCSVHVTYIFNKYSPITLHKDCCHSHSSCVNWVCISPHTRPCQRLLILLILSIWWVKRCLFVVLNSPFLVTRESQRLSISLLALLTAGLSMRHFLKTSFLLFQRKKLPSLGA